MGHAISVSLTTGALSMSVIDRSAPYHARSFSVVRSYDAQEQFTQSDYLLTHPNTDPRPHFFGNWALDHEASVSATWDRAYAELMVESGSAGDSLAYRSEPEFAVHQEDGAEVEQLLRAWGIPGRTLQLLNWAFQPGDLLLKSRQADLSILSGRYQPETLIDPVQAELWRFTPASGVGEHYTSAYSYQQFIDIDGMREANVPIVCCLTNDALGHTIAFHPTATGPPYRTWVIEDGAGRRYKLDLETYLTYLDGDNPGNNAKAYVVTQLTDESAPQSAPIRYGYDGAGRLITVDYPGQTGGSPRRYTYTYDNRGALLLVTDPVGDSLAFEYMEDDVDADARLLPRLKIKRITDGDSNQIDYQYDPIHGITRATFTGAGSDTRTVEVQYLEDTDDTHQRYITSQTVGVTLGSSSPQTITTRSVYTNDGRFLPLQAIDPLGNITRLEYNGYNQMTAVVDPLGHRREFTYDVAAQPTVAIPNRYDLVNTFETSVDVDGNPYNIQTTYRYARYDAISSPDAADTAQSTHRVMVRTDPLGNTSRFDYDDQRNYFPLRASRFIDPLGNVSTRSYDNRGTLLSETDAVGNTSQWAYDPLGRVLSSTDPNGNTRHWLYDPSTGWLVTATDALGAAGDPAHSIQYEWNDVGQRIRDTDAVGAKTEYAYYPSTRLHSVTQYDPAPRVISFAFDAVGNLTGLTDPAGNTVVIRHDEANRAYEIAQSGGASPVRFERDLAGRVTQMSDRNGAVTTYGYDPLGRLVSVREPDWPYSAPANRGKQVGITYDPQGKRLRVSDTEAAGDYLYRYDPAGNLIERDDPDGSKLLFSYDARNALVRIRDGASAIDLQFTLDGTGRLLSLTDSAYIDPSRTYSYHRNAGPLVDNLYGIDYDASGIATRFGYDSNRQLTLAHHSRPGATLPSYGYGYRSDGLVGSQTGTPATTYDYDGRKQLISEGLGTRDGYDAAGNRLWRDSAAQQAVFDAQNRMLSDGHGTTYDYDANGNVIKRTPPGGAAPTTYTYDGANRLRLVNNGATNIRYNYDADGRMTERISQHRNSTETRGYRYVNRTIMAELDAQGNIAVLYTRDDAGRLLRRRSPTSLRPQPTRDPHSLYYLSDGLGSVVRMVDWDGHSHLSCNYDAWGESTSPVGIATFRYRSGYEDIDTSLTSFGARWYDPSIGRWFSADPLLVHLAATLEDPLPNFATLSNLYIYVSNNPLNRADPTGLQGISDASPPSWIEAAVNKALDLPDYWSISLSGGEIANASLTVAWSNRGPGVVVSEGAGLGVGLPIALTLSAGFIHAPWRSDPTTNDEVLAQLTGWCVTGQASYVAADGFTYSPLILGGTGGWSGEAGLGTPTASVGLSYGWEITHALQDWFSDAVNGIKKIYGVP